MMTFQLMQLSERRTSLMLAQRLALRARKMFILKVELFLERKMMMEQKKA